MSYDRRVQPRRRRRHAAEIQCQLDARWPGRDQFEQPAGPEHNESRNTAKYNLYPFSSGNAGNNNYFAGPADKLDLRRDGLHFTYDGIYNDISPGFVSMPGFMNRVDIRETVCRQPTTDSVRRKAGWSTGDLRSCGATTSTTRASPGHRLFALSCRFRAAGRRSSIYVPTRNCASACGRRISAFYGFVLPDIRKSGLPRAQQWRIHPDQCSTQGDRWQRVITGETVRILSRLPELRLPLDVHLFGAPGYGHGHAHIPSDEAAED